MRTGRRSSFLCGIAAATLSHQLLRQALLLRFRRDVAALNAGDYRPLLSAYAEDAVLHFNEGPHRWSGEHRGRAAIERFLQEFTAAGLRGELGEIWVEGPPWALRLAARFDDEAVADDGTRLYANRIALVLRTRWGKVVEQRDFYEDTARILALEQGLRERGSAPVAS